MTPPPPKEAAGRGPAEAQAPSFTQSAFPALATKDWLPQQLLTLVTVGSSESSKAQAASIPEWPMAAHAMHTAADWEGYTQTGGTPASARGTQGRRVPALCISRTQLQQAQPQKYRIVVQDQRGGGSPGQAPVLARRFKEGFLEEAFKNNMCRG